MSEYEKLAETLEGLAAKATPGPWDYVTSVVWIPTYNNHGEPEQQKVADTGDECDAALIVTLVNALLTITAALRECAKLRRAA